MSEIKDFSDVAFQAKLEAVAAEPEALRAIRDTWRFMTGEEMPEALISETLGAGYPSQPFSLWGLKFAAQAHAFSEIDPTYHFLLGEEARAEIMINLSQDIALPPPDLAISRLIEKLGERILETAYLCLGPNIDTIIAQTKSDYEGAKDALEAANVLVRAFVPFLISLGNEDDELNPSKNIFRQDGRAINHILKLSPQFISNEKDTGLKPSCYALSMIAASFFQQCGVEWQMHAGVTNSKSHFPAMLAGEVIAKIKANALAHGTYISDAYQVYLDKEGKESDEYAFDYDPHAAVICRIRGEWLIYDPYGRSINFLDSKSAPYLDTSADLINAFPGLEVIAHPDLRLTLLRNYYTALGTFDFLQETRPDITKWAKALDTAIAFNDPNVLLQLYAVSPTEDNRANRTVDLGEMLVNSTFLDYAIDNMFNELPDTPDEQTSDRLVHDLTEEYVLDALAEQVFGLDKYDEAKIKKCLERCKTDERYYHDRIEDLFVWPEKLYLRAMQDFRSLLGDWPTEEMRFHRPHYAVEIGQLEHRIGTLALLDVSGGLGYELPLSFWTRQSSSQLPWLYYHLRGSHTTATQTEQTISTKLSQYMDVDYSRYRQIIRIINKGLEKGTEDGQAQDQPE